jgi:WD40 repeat protein
MLASGCDDGTVRVWDTTTGRAVTLRGGKGWITSVAFSTDGTFLAAGHDKTVQLWDLSTRRATTTYVGSHTVSDVWFLAGTKVLAIATSSEVHLWDVASRRKGAVNNISGTPSPDGRTLAEVGASGAVRLWDVAAGKITATYSSSGRFASDKSYAFAFTPDGGTLVIPTVGDTFLLDTTNGNIASAPHLNRGDGWTVAPDGRTLATFNNNEVYLWNIDTGHKIVNIASRNELGRFIRAISFGPDGKKLAVRTFDTLALWDISLPYSSASGEPSS